MSKSFWAQRNAGDKEMTCSVRSGQMIKELLSKLSFHFRADAKY